MARFSCLVEYETDDAEVGEVWITISAPDKDSAADKAMGECEGAISVLEVQDA